jgi:hypothetical protein
MTHLLDEDRAGYIELINTEYPLKPIVYESHGFNELKKTKVFLRDGFIDHYS